MFDRIDDDDILAQAAIQDVDAFATLYRRYIKRVYNYHISRVGNIAEAEDLTSQTFMAALKSIGNYKSQGNFPAWLMRIARNKAIDFYREKQDSLSLEHIEPLIHPVLPVDVLLDKQLQMEEIVAVLKQINNERAEALRLRIFGELSHAEIAIIMEKSEGAVKNLVYRALNDLRKYFSVEEKIQNEQA